MNTQKRVFNKLAEETKVELATQKVDLSIIGDAKKAVSDLNAKSKSFGPITVSLKILNAVAGLPYALLPNC